MKSPKNTANTPPKGRAKRISAETLIELAIATLRTEISPHLPADKRYDTAMVVNALEIARREMKADSEMALWPLLDTLYEDGDGSPTQLALDIRAGTISETTTPGLGDKLMAIVSAELEIRNPKFLQSRRAG